MPSVSQKQQKAMGIAHAMQKGEMPMTPGTPAGQIAASMSPSDVTDFASTPRKGLPRQAPKKKKGDTWNGQPVKRFK